MSKDQRTLDMLSNVWLEIIEYEIKTNSNTYTVSEDYTR